MSKEIAKSVVRECMNIRGDDVVWIGTWQHMVDLASLISIECNKIGAKSIMTLETDPACYSFMLDTPIALLKKPNPTILKLCDESTVNIFIVGPANPLRMPEISAERWAAKSEGEKYFIDRMAENKKRTVYISLGLVTPQRAETYGFNYEAWKENVTAATAVNYKLLREFGTKVKSILSNARKVHVTGKNVDLTLDLGNRRRNLSDGVIDEKDMKIGTYEEYLPAGNVLIAPIETSAEGYVEFDLPVYQVSKVIEGLKWTFKSGKVVDYDAKKNIEAIKEWWKQAKGDKDRIGAIYFGINPIGKLGYLDDCSVRGAVSISIGDNRNYGGQNDSDYIFEGTLSKATVELDGKLFIKEGKYVF